MSEAMHVDTVGGGANVVVMVHGLGGSSSVWWPQVTALRGRHRLLLPELPGSARTPSSGSASIDGFVGALVDLLDAHAVAKADFVGHSLGTLVLRHLAARHPDRVSRLALVGPTKAPADAARQAMHDRAAKVRREGMGPLADQLLGSAISQSTRDTAPVAVAFVREVLLGQTPEGYARTCEALAAASEPDAAVTCPVLLLVGALDGARAVGEALARELEDARLEIVPESGHWLTIERPEPISKSLAAFLDT